MGCDVRTSKMEKQKKAAAPAETEQRADEKDVKTVDALALTLEDRKAIYADFLSSLKANYTFQKIKSKNIDMHFKKCVEVEEKAPASPWMNLRFQDRFRECLAGLQDSHLQVRTRGARMMTGVTLRQIGSRFFVESIRSDAKFVEHYQNRLNRDITEVLKPGTEVTQINGGSIKRILEPLAKKIAASTDLALSELSVAALTERDFQYTRRATHVLTISKDGKSEEITLDWYHEETPDTVTRDYFASLKLEKVAFPVHTTEWIGYSAQLPLVKGAPAYTDESGRVVLRRAAIDDKDGKACYVQLLTFNSDNVIVDGASVTFAAALEKILGACQLEGRALLLDLRSSAGGNLANVEALMHILAVKEKSYPLFTTGLRTRNFIELNLQAGGAHAAAADTAYRESLEYLPLILGSTAVKAGSFTLPVAVMVSPRCMSACDVFAAYIDLSGRGTLVGQPTAGAFGTLLAVQGEARSVWVDQKYNTFVVQVPNSFMGVLSAAPKEGEVVKYDPKNHMLEGTAIAPKEAGRYRLLVEDLSSNGARILGKARALVKTP